MVKGLVCVCVCVCEMEVFGRMNLVCVSVVCLL